MRLPDFSYRQIAPLDLPYFPFPRTPSQFHVKGMNPTLADVAARAVVEQKPADLFCFLKTRFHADLLRGVHEADFSKPLSWIFPDHSALLFFRERPNSLLAFRSLDVALHGFMDEKK